MSSTQEWGVQVAAAAVCGWALGKLLVEVAAAGIQALARRLGRRKGALDTTGP